MERTLAWEPGGLHSGATLALTRGDLREVTLPLFSFFNLKKLVFFFKYLFVWLRSVLVAARTIFHCGTQGL